MVKLVDGGVPFFAVRHFVHVTMFRDTRLDRTEPSEIYLDCPRCSFGGHIEQFLADEQCPVCNRELTLLVAPIRLLRQEPAVVTGGEFMGKLGFVSQRLTEDEYVLLRLFDSVRSTEMVPERYVVEVSLPLEEYLYRAGS